MVITINTVILAVLIIELAGMQNHKKIKILLLRIEKISCYMILITEKKVLNKINLLVADALIVLSVVEKLPNIV